MRRFVSLVPRALFAVVVTSLVLWLPAEATLGQALPDLSEPAGGEQVVDESTVVDPETTVPDPTPPGPDPEQQPDTSRDGTDRTDTVGVVAGEDGSTSGSEPVPLDAGYGNAARQSRAAKKAEANEDCSQSHPPVSRMLGLGGIVGADADTSWHWLVIAVGVTAALFATAAFVIRRRRAAPGASPPPRGRLESVAALVAICAGLAGLAVQFIPGVGVREHPPPDAKMTVREVHARITRGEYAHRTGANVGLGRQDRREVGNVVWLELELKGYTDRQPVLQYGLYDPVIGGALLPGTEKQIDLNLENRDVQSVFVPIWIGYPKSQRFEAQFRLLEGQRVRQMTSTGKLPGTDFRYACV
jgi:hypothetical protein